MIGEIGVGKFVFLNMFVIVLEDSKFVKDIYKIVLKINGESVICKVKIIFDCYCVRKEF